MSRRRDADPGHEVRIATRVPVVVLRSGLRSEGSRVLTTSRDGPWHRTGSGGRVRVRAGRAYLVGGHPVFVGRVTEDEAGHGVVAGRVRPSRTGVVIRAALRSCAVLLGASVVPAVSGGPVVGLVVALFCVPSVVALWRTASVLRRQETRSLRSLAGKTEAAARSYVAGAYRSATSGGTRRHGS